MADSRKPLYTILFRPIGSKNSTKIEMFHSSLYGRNDNKYRLRVDGRWYPRDVNAPVFYTKEEVMEELLKSLPWIEV